MTQWIQTYHHNLYKTRSNSISTSILQDEPMRILINSPRTCSSLKNTLLVALRFIEKVKDEVSKNHQADRTNIITACMPESPDNKYCPVTSFVKYTDHLSPLMPELWQYPKTVDEIQGSEIWYKNRKIGPNPLSTFMSKLSHDCDLSRVYTNHSIRVTGATFLSRHQFSPKQIMAITGHKSLNSLAIYEKVSTDEKMSMAYSMSYYLQMDQPTIPAVEAPGIRHSIMPLKPISKPTSTVTSASASTEVQKENTPSGTLVLPTSGFESEDPFADAPDIPDFNIQEIIECIEKETTTSTQQTNQEVVTRKTEKAMVKKSSPKIPLFNNCKIGNINIILKK